MERAFQTALWLLRPEIVFILGDIFDEGKWSSQKVNQSSLFYPAWQSHRGDDDDDGGDGDDGDVDDEGDGDVDDEEEDGACETTVCGCRGPERFAVDFFRTASSTAGASFIRPFTQPIRPAFREKKKRTTPGTRSPL